MNWIKPSELPEKFHSQVWVAYKYSHDTEPREPYVAMVQNHYRGTIPEEWNGEQWEFISDEDSRVMFMEKPSTDDAFKERSV